ncbi:MAG: SRPBCC family protein [Pseudomonadota bacterium]|nr:SRPBCC family protein [Pseudomonadota bacterium]
MKFSTRKDIDAPIDHVFASVSDFQVYERAAMRRGAQVRRLDNQDVKGPGMAWQADFEFRGKKRVLEITLEDYEAPTNLEFLGTSGGLSGACEIELIALSPSKTRLKLSVDLRPQTLSARLLVQSLKLAKGNLDKKFDARVAELSDNVAAQYRQTA